MEQRGGCCIARYTGGSGGGVYNMSKVDRMMMKFRPIAPKPASPTPNTMPKQNEPVVKSTGRGKRRNATCKTNAVGKKKKSTSSSEEKKTLSLIPEAPGVKDMINPRIESPKMSFPRLLNFSNVGHVSPNMGHVTSFVKVECVIDTWVLDGCGWYGAMGRTDEERVMGLDLDTCPGFVTDGLNRVRWTNAAYLRNMVGGGGEVVVVVERGLVLPVGVAGFTCRVRCGGGQKGGSNSKTVPCDVWRMDCGGFAWRLDTAAALSLGR